MASVHELFDKLNLSYMNDDMWHMLSVQTTTITTITSEQ